MHLNGIIYLVTLKLFKSFTRLGKIMLRKFGASVALASLTAGFMAMTPAASAADELAANPAYLAGVNAAYTHDKALLAFNVDLVDVPADSTVTVTVLGCTGNPVLTTTHHKSGNFEARTQVSYEASKLVGGVIGFVITHDAPGFEPKTKESTFPHKFAELAQATCEGRVTEPPVDEQPPVVDEPEVPSTMPLVRKWGFKRGVPKVSRNVFATAPKVAPGARVKYRWTVKGRAVDNDRYLRLRRSMVGKRPKLAIVVSKAGVQSKTRVLTFRPVRKR